MFNPYQTKGMFKYTSILSRRFSTLCLPSCTNQLHWQMSPFQTSCAKIKQTQQLTVPENVTKYHQISSPLKKRTHNSKGMDFLSSSNHSFCSGAEVLLLLRVFVSFLCGQVLILRGISCHAMSCHKSYRTELVEVSCGNPQRKNHDMGISVLGGSSQDL